MPISIDLTFAFRMEKVTDVLLQFEAAVIPEQKLLETDTWVTRGEHFARIHAQDDIGERVWIRAEGRYDVSYKAVVAVERMPAEIGQLEHLPPHDRFALVPCGPLPVVRRGRIRRVRRRRADRGDPRLDRGQFHL